MSFLTVVEQDATIVEQAVVSGCKSAVDALENTIVTDILPVLQTQLMAAIEKLGQEAVALLLGDALASPSASADQAAAS